MFGLGGPELLVILLFAFLIFGPDKLPEAGKMIGKGIRRFREAQNDVNDIVQENIYKPLKKAMDTESAPGKTPDNAPSTTAGTPTAPVGGTQAALAGDGGTGEMGVAPENVKPATQPSPSSAATQKKETFAERRARLEREAALKAEVSPESANGKEDGEKA